MHEWGVFGSERISINIVNGRTVNLTARRRRLFNETRATLAARYMY